MARRADEGFRCRECDYRSPKWLGRCPDCGTWAGLEAETARDRPSAGPSAECVPYADLPERDAERTTTGVTELDRVLGGGLVPGAVILLGGEPGIGKSTLLLQVAARYAARGCPTLYVSGEESAAQLRGRGNRLGVEAAALAVTVATDPDAVVRAAHERRYGLILVDSIQAMRCRDVDAAPGSVRQVREAAARLTEHAKREGVPTLLVGHVTKDGALAGPRVLEHLVDTVLQFEGEAQHEHRLVRARKNRFGPTDELGVFRMTERGLEEVPNPSEYLLSRRPVDRPGSAVAAAVEGTRPLLVEVQALVGDPTQGSPRRTALGVDGGRVALILAVLERAAGLRLGDRDVFVNVTGGIGLRETASDLAVAAAIASSAKGRALPSGTVLAGEIGLTGEIRSVSRPELRLREAARLGFSHAVVPEGAPTRVEGIRRVEVGRVEQALVSCLDQMG